MTSALAGWSTGVTAMPHRSKHAADTLEAADLMLAGIDQAICEPIPAATTPGTVAT